MKKHLIAAAVVFPMLTGPALAQATIQLTPDQRTTVYGAVTAAPPPPPSVSFDVTVGTTVPEAVELHAMPPSVGVETVTPYQYVVVDNQVVLVDPGTRTVVQVIEQ